MTLRRLRWNSAERGVSVSDLVATLVTLETEPFVATETDIAELDRRWKAFEAQDKIADHRNVVGWLQTWGTSGFRSRQK